jgi:hypothetical protein
MKKLISLSFLATALAFAACGDSKKEEEAYDTYQDCFDDHTSVEMLPVQEAIVVCCIEHPIAGMKVVCGNTAADCVTYLGVNLSSSSATSADVSAACDDYVTQKGM